MATPDPAVIGTVPVAAPDAANPPESTEPPKPPKVPVCNPPEAFDELSDMLRRIEAARGRRLFALVPGLITDDTQDEVCRWRNDLKAAGEDNGLDILIHSPGGILNSCYQLARFIGSRVDAWDALIPSMAASGATLLTLGSANVVMGEMAALGPIDPQVISKRQEKLFASERQSPLEAFEAVRYLRQFALESLHANWSFLLDQRIAPKPALDTATQLAVHLAQPILSKIEPYDLGSFALDSRLALQYCERVGNPSNLSKRTQRNVPYRKLVEQYPAHEFIIDREEARALRFNVAEPSLEIDDMFEDLRPMLNRVEAFIGFLPPQTPGSAQ